jgi:hypothetical protein
MSHFRNFQRIIPGAGIHIWMAYLYTMLARIAHDLGRRVKTHGLRIE